MQSLHIHSFLISQSPLFLIHPGPHINTIPQIPSMPHFLIQPVSILLLNLFCKKILD